MVRALVCASILLYMFMWTVNVKMHKSIYYIEQSALKHTFANPAHANPGPHSRSTFHIRQTFKNIHSTFLFVYQVCQKTSIDIYISLAWLFKYYVLQVITLYHVLFMTPVQDVQEIHSTFPFVYQNCRKRQIEPTSTSRIQPFTYTRRKIFCL